MDKITPIIAHRQGAQEQTVLMTPKALLDLKNNVMSAEGVNKPINTLGISSLAFSFWGWGTTGGTPEDITSLPVTFQISIVGWPWKSPHGTTAPLASVNRSLSYPAAGRLLWNGTLGINPGAKQVTRGTDGSHPFTGVDPGVARVWYAADTIGVAAGFDVAPKKRCNYSIYDGGGDDGVAVLELDDLNVADLYVYVTNMTALWKAMSQYGVEIGVQPLDFM